MSWDEHTEPIYLRDRYGDVMDLCMEERRQKRAFRKLALRMIRRAKRRERIEGAKALFRRIFR